MSKYGKWPPVLQNRWNFNFVLIKLSVTLWHFQNGLIHFHMTFQSVDIDFFSTICYSGYNVPLYWQPPLFQILSTPPPSLSSPTATPTALSVVLFFWLNGWSHHIWCAILIKMILWICTCWALVHLYQKDFDVFYATRHQVYWGQHMMGFFAGTLIWYHTYKHTQKKQCIQGPVDYPLT